MDHKNYSWLLGTVAVLVTLLILFGGQAVWHKFAVAAPLDRAFQDINGVEKAEWEEGKNGSPMTLRVRLHNVDNLQKTYRDIDTNAKRVLGKTPYTIVLTDNRSPELDKLYYDLHYSIQEATFTGHFSVMAKQIQEQADKAGVLPRVYVDAEYVYLELVKEQAGLYVVIPRTGQGVK